MHNFFKKMTLGAFVLIPLALIITLISADIKYLTISIGVFGLYYVSSISTHRYESDDKN